MTFIEWVKSRWSQKRQGAADVAVSAAKERHGKVKRGLFRSRVEEPKDIPDLVSKIETDVQFLLGKLVISAMIQAAPITIEAPADDAVAVALADNLRQRFREVLPFALEAFGYGRAAFEVCYGEYDATSGCRFVREINPLPYAATSMSVDNDGDFTGVIFKTKKTKEHPAEEITIPARESWWFALDATPQEPHGRSRYMGAPKEVWKKRQALEKNDEIWTKKFALGHGVGYAPAEYPSSRSQVGAKGEIGDDGEVADPMEDMRVALETLGSGGIAIFDSGSHSNGQPLFKYEPPSTRQDAGPLDTRRRVLDAAALRSLGVPERAVTQDESTGSYSMAEVHWRVLGATCDGILSQIVASYQRQVVDRATAINFDPATAPKLTIVAGKVQDELRATVMEIVKAVVLNPTPSPLITYGVLDFGKLLEKTGLPLGDDVAAKLDAIKQSLATPSMLAMSTTRRLGATTPDVLPDDVMRPDDIAEQAIEEIRETYRQIAEHFGRAGRDRNALGGRYLRRPHAKTQRSLRAGHTRQSTHGHVGPVGAQGHAKPEGASQGQANGSASGDDTDPEER